MFSQILSAIFAYFFANAGGRPMSSIGSGSIGSGSYSTYNTDPQCSGLDLKPGKINENDISNWYGAKNNDFIEFEDDVYQSMQSIVKQLDEHCSGIDKPDKSRTIATLRKKNVENRAANECGITLKAGNGEEFDLAKKINNQQ